MHTNSFYSTTRQRGGTFLGLVLGVLIGLFAALAVAVYVTKVPIPFSKRNNTAMGTIEQEQAKNQDWDPNAPLAGKKASTASANSTASAPTQPENGDAAAPRTKTEAEAKPNEKLKPSPKPALDPDSDDPLADLLKSKTAPSPKPQALQGDLSTAMTVEPFIYYVQIGAFVNSDEAESQRAKAAMAGFDARISEREQAGRQIFRVRLGPFDSKDLADRAKSTIEATGLDGALVRVQR